MKYLFLILLLCAELDGMQEQSIPMGKNMTSKELAEKACSIIGLTKNESVLLSMEHLFTSTNLSAAQQQRKNAIIRKISESQD